jgi:hypothetical protein
MADEKGAPLDKQVVRMPDGRQLIYYRFASAPPRPDPEAPPPAPRKRKPRGKD